MISKFTVQGHSGYAEAGSDIVCAAVSSAVELAVNIIAEELAIPVTVSADEESAAVTLELSRESEKALSSEKKRFAYCGVLNAFEAQMRRLAEEYPKNIKIIVSDHVV